MWSGKLTFPCFPRQGGREAAGRTSPERAASCSRRPVFTLNQTLPPRPLAARPRSINTSLTHFLHSPLQLDRWSMKEGTWESKASAGKCELIFQRSLARGDGREWLLLSWLKSASLIVNLSIFHRFDLEPMRLNRARVLLYTRPILPALNFKPFDLCSHRQIATTTAKWRVMSTQMSVLVLVLGSSKYVRCCFPFYSGSSCCCKAWLSLYLVELMQLYQMCQLKSLVVEENFGFTPQYRQ